jgi:signal transduction histidine kinase
VKEWSGSSHSQASAFDTIMLCPFNSPWRYHRPAFSSGIAKPHLTSSLQKLGTRAAPVGPHRVRSSDIQREPKDALTVGSSGFHRQEDFIVALAAFIRSNEEAIIAEWEAFARTYVPAAAQMDKTTLRDDITGLLRFIADDLHTAQTERERSEKGKGQGPKEGGADDSAAEVHADLRFLDGFDTVQMLSEFRALRASVVKLWGAEWNKTEHTLPDLIRFNESIDQIMTESVTRFTKKLDFSGDLFLGTLVHDLRNPLSAVYRAAQVLLLRGKLDDEQVKMVSQIKNSSARISHLVSDLIDAFRVRLGKGMPITPAAMDIGTAVHEAAKEIQSAHPDWKIKVETTGDLVGVWDLARVEQVLSNLIGNAGQHGLKTSAIDVAVKGAGPEVILSVHNEGSIPADAVATIFNPLTRGEDKNQSPGKTTSLGLGLFIAKEIVAAHGGELGVTSSEEEGTTFTAHLPRKPPELRAS